MPLETDEERRWAYFLPDQEIPDEAVELAPESVREWKILDPAVGSGHFLVVALGLLLALFQEEARHRGQQDAPEWSVRAIVEHLLAHTLHGIDIDPRAVQIAAASLCLKGKALSPEMQPAQLNLVAPNLRLADLPDDDPALVEFRQGIEAETGIAWEFANKILQALRGADHLGSLLKMDSAVEAAVQLQEDKIAWMKQPRQQELLEQEGIETDDQTLEFSADDARTTIQRALDQFLTSHSSGNDLGLRLHGEQLAAGVRFALLLKEASYHLVVANPPYQGTGRLASSNYVELHYPLGKSDLYACFLLRGLELVLPGGISSMLTMRSWMFLKQSADLRAELLRRHTLVGIGDFDRGAFEDIPDEVVSVCASTFRRLIAPFMITALSACPTPRDDCSRDSERTARKRVATLAHEGVYRFFANELKAIPESPLIYWLTTSDISLFKHNPSIGSEGGALQGISTANNTRFLRLPWEIHAKDILLSRTIACRSKISARWVPYIKGAAGDAWIEPLSFAISWKSRGIDIQEAPGSAWRNDSAHFCLGLTFPRVGSRFSARIHRYASLFDAEAPTFTRSSPWDIACYLNSSLAKRLMRSLNPTQHFTQGDIARLPSLCIAESERIADVLNASFNLSESHRESSVEYRFPGPDSWPQAQNWAQQSVDRTEGAPLPEYTERLIPEPPSNHLSFALGVVLGRFAPVDEQGHPTTSNPAGILDPAIADLTHALPAGLLFLDGSLEDNDMRDGLGAEASAPLQQAWSEYGASINANRSLRDWLRLDLFKDVHKGMYENRPIHWPLSSPNKTFIAWVNIHRMNSRSLKDLLADHLIPARSRIDGELDDLRQVRDSHDRKAAREADTRIGKLSRWREELQAFIDAVEQCADHGPPPTDGRCPKREQDDIYDPDLDDGVMINSAALWPLLEPQWKDPKKWWKELASAQGKKDYDWAHLAMRYWPTRVDAKCQHDPSLGVAHGCFWRYHPERAWAWELRLQQEIAPDFRIEEPPYCPGGRDLGDQGDASHRQAWLSDHPEEALAAVEKEAIRRMGRGDNRQVVSEMRLLEAGLWSVLPEKVAAMEQRLSDRQGALFNLRAPDEAEGRAVVGEQSVQGGLALALGGLEGTGA
jgi:hypothetical protein